MKMISANKLNRLWKNGVLAKMIAKTKVLKTMEEISANTSAENVAGATAVKELSNSLNSHPQFIYDSSGKITGYKTKAGADTVFPFSGGNKMIYFYYGHVAVPSTLQMVSTKRDFIDEDACSIDNQKLIIKKSGKYRIFVKHYAYAGNTTNKTTCKINDTIAVENGMEYNLNENDFITATASNSGISGYWHTGAICVMKTM